FSSRKYKQVEVLRKNSSDLDCKALSCLNFKKEYERKEIFDFSIAFESGINFIIGQNGVGKSTFINLLMGLTRGKGEVFYNGVKVKKRYKNIFAVMQDVNYQLFTESVWQEISTITKDDELKNEILRTVNLFDKKEMHPNSLSGGEK
ncbi:ATP-binding cassette domain-containing protein, partial [Bacillus licheniformis]|uniref:ATP-binding cassette domain-containing protein n=1 Tax=Bacillus licheniformis TaxID=1402 RepID=UPI000F5F3297